MQKAVNASSKEEILVITDETGVPDKLEALIQAKGYRAVSASTFKEAKRLLNVGGFALMIIEIAADAGLRRKIIKKAGHIQPKLSVMVLTGIGDFHHLDQILNYCLKWFISRPAVSNAKARKPRFSVASSCATA